MATKKCTSQSHLLVAAFDFGTTYSGYAFSFLNEPLKIQTNAGWNSGTEKLISLKTPTCVLLTPRKEFHSFGFEAENKYADLAEDDQHHGWLLFRRFKMLLHNNTQLSRSTTVDDINGVSMPAKTLFAMSIRFLRNHFLGALNKQMSGVEDGDIKYILTVPAIWNDNAKQFMREAAIEAGIEDSQLKLALEPEAASIWCQIVTTDATIALSKAGTQYMVVDLGGGTADISVHEKQIDNTLKELHRASGGPWGGNAVDNNYIQWLTKLFGERTLQKFKEEQMEDYFNMFREFETKKRSIKDDTEGKVTFRLSASLREIHAHIEKVTLKNKTVAIGLETKIAFSGDKVRIDASIIKEWFEEPVSKMISHVQRILAQPNMKKVGTILLVGGFGESELVQADMQRKIRNQRIIIPNDAGLVVLKGAVRFGHIPDIVSCRIMHCTYGVAVMETFDENKHPTSKVVIKGNEKMIDDIFEIFVHAEEEIKVGQKIHKTNFIPLNLQESGILIYSSYKRDPKYVTDEGCNQLGTMTIRHPEGDTFEDKKFDVTFVFGDTELLVRAKIIKTGQEFSTYVDCLK